LLEELPRAATRSRFERTLPTQLRSDPSPAADERGLVKGVAWRLDAILRSPMGADWERFADLLEVRFSERDGRRVEYALRGEIDLSNSGALADHLEQLNLGVDQRLHLDLAGIEFVDSSGLRALAGLQHRLQERGGGLVLLRPSPPVIRVLRVSGLDDYFEIWSVPGEPRPPSD
jgi:anti-sigma B factor antagonist